MLIKKVISIIVFIIIFQSLQAQVKGIKFEHNYKWNQTLAKAKIENKHIFVDCYTTWCGPCKYMDTSIFPLEEVGNFFNKNFINVKFQFDSTPTDIEEIKAQYTDAVFMKMKYKLNGYPTYLFFNPDGELVHQEGGSSSANEFITKGTNALNEGSQYHTQIKKYDAGVRDAAFLKNLTKIAINAHDEKAISKYAKDYYSTQNNLLSINNLQFVYETTLNVGDTGFNLMSNNISEFETVVNKKKLKTTLKFIIIRSEFSLNNNIGQNWDSKKWDSFANSLFKKYPLFAREVLPQFKMIIFPGQGNWMGYAEAIEKYIVIQMPSNTELNEYAWTIFGNCDDRVILKKALRWSKMSFTNKEKIDPGFIDTYANLLYKMGRKNEALEWEMKAQKIAIEQGLDKNWGQDVIDKIIKGEKTW